MVCLDRKFCANRQFARSAPQVEAFGSSRSFLSDSIADSMHPRHASHSAIAKLPAYNARMPTLRRILKYTPAAVFGVLVVAWVASWFGRTATNLPPMRCLGEPSLQSAESELRFSWAIRGKTSGTLFHLEGLGWHRVLGTAQYRISGSSGRIVLPYPLLITVVVPLALAPFLRFRFRLWHYLAYTALVAVELAYYLRWRE
jgi:hypothetical protein